METIVGNDIENAVKILKAGHPVAIPTETVYGLAANALSSDAVLNIFKAKNRPHFNPLIIHLPDWDSVRKYVTEIPNEAEVLAQKFSPGPLTFLLEKKNIIPDLVTAGSSKVAVRIPAHPLTRQLLHLLDFPIAAPSANPFGYVSPTTAQHVLEGLNGEIPYILDGGPCQVGLESTIVDFDNQQVIIRRKGGIAVEAIEEAIGKKVLIQTGVEEHPVAPGQLKSHYATTTPLYVNWSEDMVAQFSPQKIAVITFGKNIEDVTAEHRFQLSANADFEEAAKNLFATMRKADVCGATIILTRFLPEEGLGMAINDRLRRAVHDSKD
ncbi:MAG: threonylcarbamoyl-AMP synthase [Bacteroidetes bacterium]|nr:threonylcarbamoyl-AMP synthase [Bacteroidota bacterium]